MTVTLHTAADLTAVRSDRLVAFSHLELVQGWRRVLNQTINQSILDS